MGRTMLFFVFTGSASNLLTYNEGEEAKSCYFILKLIIKAYEIKYIV